MKFPIKSKVNSKVILFTTLVFSFALTPLLLGFNVQQSVAIAVITMEIAGSLIFWEFRLAFGFIGLSLLFILGLITVELFVEFASLDVIIFLIATMIIIGHLENMRFFEYLVDKIIAFAKGNVYKLVSMLMISSAFFAALVNEVTSILFMGSAVFHLASVYNVNPIPLLIMVVFATNIGSSATVIGNPIGVLIALRGGLSFTDFLRWATPVALIALSLAIIVCLLYYHKDIVILAENMNKVSKRIVVDAEEPGKAMGSELKSAWVIFIFTLLGFAFHKPMEELLNLEEGSMLLGVAIFMAGIVLLLNRERARELVELRVEWWTLGFFIALFASVGTLEYVGVTHILAEYLFHVGVNEMVLRIVFIYLAGFMSAFLDNILAVATLIPIVEELKLLGIDSFPLWWSMLFAGTFFGNLTPIGSTANIVALGMLERRKTQRLTMVEWLKPGVLVSFLTLSAAFLLLYLQLPP